MKTLLLSSQDIARIVHAIGLDRLMDETIDGIAHACLTFDPRQYSVPVRDGFSYDDEHKGLLEWMPVIRFRDRVMMKLVAYHPGNPQQHNLPTVLSTAVTFDTLSGHATSIIDATFLTSLRTGAASAVASEILAPRDSKTLGLIGAGAQAVTQLHALSRRFDLETVFINDIDPKACNTFTSRARIAGIDTRVEVTPVEDIVREADIICTATSIDVGKGPLFDDTESKPAVHINAVGSDFPGKTELPRALLKRSLVCPDFREQAVAEGECQELAADEIGPDLVELVKKREHFAAYRDKSTVFDSTGWAMEDFVAGNILARLARENGLGMPVEMECISADPKDPYGFIERYAIGEGRPLKNRLHSAWS